MQNALPLDIDGIATDAQAAMAGLLRRDVRLSNPDLLKQWNRNYVLRLDAAAAVALASFHVRTAGHGETFQKLRDEAEGKRHLSIRERQPAEFRKLLLSVRKAFTSAGVRPSRGFAEEYEAVCDRLRNPGPFLTFTNGDIAPTNVFFTPSGPRLIDFEYCGYRHAFYDTTWWRIGLPLPDAAVDRIDRAYLDGIVGLFPTPPDATALYKEIASISAHRLFWCLTWAFEDALREPGVWVDDFTLRQAYTTYLRAFITVAERADILPAMRSSAQSLQDRLTELWGEADTREYNFPVFR
ncbi:MAG: hypothetical protein FJ319_03505 [SAR202 cluster bacterium]|nr:hypothetical protein [SAR202 cluster bacterium]